MERRTEQLDRFEVALIAGLEHPRPDIAEQCARILGQRRSRPAVPALLRVLTTRLRDIDVLVAAVTALGEIGDPAAVPALMEAVRHVPVAVRRAAVRALIQIDAESTRAFLTSIARDDGSGTVREEARRLLRGKEHRMTEPTLLPPLDSSEANALQLLILRIRDAVERVIVGKRDVIELLLVALLSGGHVLIEDVPGIGKTRLAHALCRAIGGTFRRIQFTPDLLPADVTGSLVYEPGRGTFSFHPGPIFANVILADEINRGTPRTQAALLEAMEERQVTVEHQTYRLPEPFLVIATQNPIEFEGTFPLPEAQVDRFAMRLRIGYPAWEDEKAMVRRFVGGDPTTELVPVTKPDELAAAIAATRRVYLGEASLEYLLRLVRHTREHEDIQLGASPRATLALARAAQAVALLEGRTFVIPDDVRAVAVPVLAHRLRLTTRAELHGTTSEGLLRTLLDEVPVPVEETTPGDH